MGYRGSIPKPNNIARAEGNPGKRRLNDCEPQPRNVAPKCPAYLDEHARQEWRRLVPVLRRMKVLTEADGMALANLCQTYSTLVKAQAKLSELGILYKAPSGYVMQRPLLGVVNQCVDTITKLSREFGLTPAARSRIIAHSEEADPEDEMMRLLSVPRLPRPERDFSQPGMKPQ